jgi:hypothetical protein
MTQIVIMVPCDARPVREEERVEKSPIISPDPESEARFFLRREIVHKSSDKRQISPCHLSQDCTLTSLSRPKSLPDSRSSRKGGYCTEVLRRTSGLSEQDTKTKLA